MKKRILTLLLIAVMTLCFCACEKAHEHIYDQKVTEAKFLASDATCLQPASYYYTCTCGEKGSETFTSGNAAGHTYETAYTYDETNHWKKAACEHTSEKTELAAHDLVPNADNTAKTCVCGYSVKMIASLAKPGNLAYAGGKLTFDAVENAEKYIVTVGTVTKEITETTLELSSLGILGNHTVKVIAAYQDVRSEEATLDVNILFVDGNVILEAEDAVLNPAHVYSVYNAHGSAVALDFNDGGQGMYFRYFAFEAGQREVDVYYGTAFPGAFMFFYVNGSNQPTKITYTEETGWLTDGGIAAKATVTLELRQGWNDIYLIKGRETVGEGAFDYGAYAQIDYIEIHGTGKEIDISNVNKNSDHYLLEVEIGKWHYANTNVRPTNDSHLGKIFSGDYYLGSVDAEGDGVTLTFTVTDAGTYKIILGYGQGGQVSINVAVNGGEKQTVTLPASGSWDKIVRGTLVESVEFTAGQKVTIDLSRVAGDGQWIVLDYVMVVKADHQHTFDQEVTYAKYFKNGANCTEPVTYFKSCLCGEISGETFIIGEALGHTYEDKWSFDTTHHWYAATCCDDKKDYAEHFFSENGGKQVCACGYEEDMPYIDNNVILEAEDAVLNQKHVYEYGNAHGGAIALDFNDCGQGMYFRYYAYEAGMRTVDVYYATGSAGSFMTFLVNGNANTATVTFDQNTGWWHDGITAAKATVELNLQKGWNDIYLIKHGDNTNNYGGWAQIDYIEIHGTGKEFPVEDTTANSYRLEAESAAWHWANGNTRPAHWGGNFSGWYGLGSLDAAGDGAKFTFKVQDAGTYTIQIAYGGQGTPPLKVTVNGETVDVTLSGSNGWDNITLCQIATFTAEAGQEITIDIGQAGQWYVFDYLLITKVEE